MRPALVLATAAVGILLGGCPDKAALDLTARPGHPGRRPTSRPVSPAPSPRSRRAAFGRAAAVRIIANAKLLEPRQDRLRRARPRMDRTGPGRVRETLTVDAIITRRPRDAKPLGIIACLLVGLAVAYPYIQKSFREISDAEAIRVAGDALRKEMGELLDKEQARSSR